MSTAGKVRTAEERGQTSTELEELVMRELSNTHIGPQMTTEEAPKLGGCTAKHLIGRGEKSVREKG